MAFLPSRATSTFLALLASSACTALPGSAAAQRAASGTGASPGGVLPISVVVREAGATVGFPSAETPAHTQRRMRDGSQAERFYAAGALRGTFYQFSIDALARPLGGNALDTLTTFVEDTLEATADSEVTSSRAVWIAGFPGVDLDLVDRERGLTRAIRLLVGRRRLYAFSVGVSHPQRATIVARRDEYFASIRLDPADAPSTAGDGQITDGAASWLYPPEGYFAVELPGNASRTDLRLALGDHEFNGYRYSLVGGTPSSRYDVMVVLFGAREPDDPVAAMQARIVGSTGTVRSSVDGAREGYAARELVVEADGTVRTVLIIHTEDAIYSVVHTCSAADEVATREARRRFVGTFRILGGDE